ncbi:Pleiotropic drug resistance protein 3 [Hordeum vulgare]|nr:Pleiotropic drug resistance protein 3 [Hordeum vulgare]
MAVGNGPKVSDIGISLEDPALSAMKAPIGLLIHVNNRKLVLKIMTKRQLIRIETTHVCSKVKGLGGGKEGLLPTS